MFEIVLKIQIFKQGRNLMHEFLRCPPKAKVQSVLILSCFAHYSRINEHKDMRLRQIICYEINN